MSGPEALVPLVGTISLFACIFGIMYLRNKENMALIEKGFNPRQSYAQPKPFVNLKYGLLLLGAGLGLLSAYFIDMNVSHKALSAGGEVYYEDYPQIYFALIAIGGGLGLVISYLIEKKQWLDKKQPE
jgi:hypothetical protein